MRSCSLGQGMEKKAKAMIEEGLHRGYWVVLQNCDLLIKFTKDLEKTLETKAAKNPHKDFRLWLTTNPHDEFPLSLLQRSFKVVDAPPDGLALNIRGTWAKMNQEELDNCLCPEFKPLAYIVSF